MICFNIKNLCFYIILVFFYTRVSYAQELEKAPGILINNYQSNSKIFVGSPSICILDNGYYLASHDEFGPTTSEYRSAQTYVFLSKDKGISWEQVNKINGQFWSTLFTYKNKAYIIGTNKHHGNVVIRESSDNGVTWTIPGDGKSGLLFEGEYHTAPVPVVFHNNRIWRSIEYATAKTTAWGKRYSAAVISASLNKSLLDAGNWRKTNILPFNENYLDKNFGAWLEGNIVVNPDGKIVNLLRVHAGKLNKEFAAIVQVDKIGKKASFDGESFIPMNGASKKFTIRYDKSSRLYLALVNYVAEDVAADVSKDKIRNNVALIKSKDLKKWELVKDKILYHPDLKHFGFQYIDWQFEGNDIIFVSRTAYLDQEGLANSAHNANMLTFHRIENYKSLIK